MKRPDGGQMRGYGSIGRYVRERQVAHQPLIIGHVESGLKKNKMLKCGISLIVS